MRLVSMLAHLEPRSLASLARRFDVSLEPEPGRKRPPLEVLAHAMAMPVVLGEIARESSDAGESLRLLASAPQGRMREELGAGLLRLVEKNLAFAVPSQPGVFALPSAYRVQLHALPSEDRRSLRVLLPRLDDDTMRGLVAHLLGKTPSTARVLVLGDLLSALEVEGRIANELRELSPRERGLFDSIVARGGEVDLEELVRLAGETSRPLSSSPDGVGVARRSVLFGLTRRGLVLPESAELIVLPTEVQRVLGRDPHGLAKKAFAQLVARARTVDLAPSRVRFANDPGPATVALFAALRAQGEELKPRAGASRTALRTAAKDAGVTPDEAELLVALGRSANLATRGLPLSMVASELFVAWKEGGVWDEARTEPDKHRAHERASSLSTPTHVIVDVLLGALAAVAPQRFLAERDLRELLARDVGVFSAMRRFERVCAREPNVFVPRLDDIVTRILSLTLPTLGLVESGASDSGSALRLSAHGRRCVAQSPAPVASSPAPSGTDTRQLSPSRFRIDASASAARVVALGDFASLFAAEGSLVCELTDASLARGAERGVDADFAEKKLALAGVPESEALRELLRRGLSHRASAKALAVSRVLAVDSPEVFAALLAKAPSVFDERSVWPLLLVREGVSAQKLKRELAAASVSLSNEA